MRKLIKRANKIPTGSNHSSHFASSLFKNSTFHVEWQIQNYLDSDDDDVIVSDPLLQIRPLNFTQRGEKQSWVWQIKLVCAIRFYQALPDEKWQLFAGQFSGSNSPLPIVRIWTTGREVGRLDNSDQSWALSLLFCDAFCPKCPQFEDLERRTRRMRTKRHFFFLFSFVPLSAWSSVENNNTYLIDSHHYNPSFPLGAIFTLPPK